MLSNSKSDEQYALYYLIILYWDPVLKVPSAVFDHLKEIFVLCFVGFDAKTRGWRDAPSCKLIRHYSTDQHVVVMHQQTQWRGRLLASKHGRKWCRFQSDQKSLVECIDHLFIYKKTKWIVMVHFDQIPNASVTLLLFLFVLSIRCIVQWHDSK